MKIGPGTAKIWWTEKKIKITRMLAINVSIPNLTIARLEHFDRHNYESRENDQQT